MDNKVLCTCIFCMQETNSYGKLLSISTRTRHRKREKNLQNSFPISNNTSNNILNNQINIVSMEDIEENIEQSKIKKFFDYLELIFFLIELIF